MHAFYVCGGRSVSERKEEEQQASLTEGVVCCTVVSLPPFVCGTARSTQQPARSTHNTHNTQQHTHKEAAHNTTTAADAQTPLSPPSFSLIV